MEVVSCKDTIGKSDMSGSSGGLRRGTFDLYASIRHIADHFSVKISNRLKKCVVLRRCRCSKVFVLLFAEQRVIRRIFFVIP